MAWIPQNFGNIPLRFCFMWTWLHQAIPAECPADLLFYHILKMFFWIHSLRIERALNLLSCWHKQVGFMDSCCCRISLTLPSVFLKKFQKLFSLDPIAASAFWFCLTEVEPDVIFSCCNPITPSASRFNMLCILWYFNSHHNYYGVNIWVNAAFPSSHSLPLLDPWERPLTLSALYHGRPCALTPIINNDNESSFCLL